MNNEYDHPNNVNSEEISLVETLFHYFSYWKLFVIFVIACLAIAGAYLFYATPQYRVVLRVLVNDDKKGQSIMDFSTFSDLGISAPKSFMDNEIEVLRSETLLRNVADSLHLEVSYFVDNGFKRNEIYKNTPVFVSIASVEASGYFTIEKVDTNTLSIDSRKEDFDRIVKIGENVISPWGLLNFKDNPFGTVPYPITVVINDPEDYLPVINIVPTSKSSSVVEISMVTANIRKGRDIINSLINLYNQNAINEKNYVAKNTISFINERLDVIAQELGSAEKEVESYRKEQGITDLEAQGKLLLSSSGEYNQKINEAEIQLNILLNIKEFLSQASNAGNLLPANIGLSDPTILSLIAGYNKVILEKQSSTAGMNENMSMVIEYNKQIAQIKDDLLKGINFAENASRLTIRELHKQESMYLGLARKLSTKERESRELIRQQTIKEQLFIYLLQKKEETGLSLAMATPNAKIIDESSPLKKVSPQTAILLLAALFSGLVFPIVIIYIKDLFDNRVHTKDDIMRTVKAPFLGEIPFAKDSSDPFPVLKVRSSIAEKFRIITSNLGFIVGELQTKVISVTSATPGDGKSFVARNLALSLATNGKRTLLIDLDIRKSVLMETLHIESQSGSVYYLSNPSVKFSEIVHIGKYHKNLDIIPVKVYPPNPSELLESERLAMLFKEVDKLYEYIIVDTAPVGLVADVYTINPFVTATLYVVRADHTYKQALLDIRDIYQAKKLNNLTCVLNAIPMSKRYGYGYNDYAYKHSYYTEE